VISDEHQSGVNPLILRRFLDFFNGEKPPPGAAPKRGVGGSNPLMDASEQRRKPLFSRVFGFSYMKRHEKALSLYEIKFYSKI